MKICSCCSKSLDESNFYKGLSSCKLCHNSKTKAWYKKHKNEARAKSRVRTSEYRAKHSDKVKESLANWRLNNKTHIREYITVHRKEINLAAKARYHADIEKSRKKARETYAKNRERYKENSRKYHADHKEQENIKSREWRKNNPEVARVAMENWRINNPDKMRAMAKTRKQNRRAALLGKGKFTTREWEDLLVSFQNRCVKCGAKERIEPDHIVPLSKGGINTIDNIQPLCRSCNAKKRVRTEDYRPDWSRFNTHD